MSRKWCVWSCKSACTSATKSIYRGYVMLAHRASILESVSMKYSYITYYDFPDTNSKIPIVFIECSDHLSSHIGHLRKVCFVK